MKLLIKNIPNTLTLLNLLFGCLAVFMAFKGAYTHAAWLIMIAVVFDFLDGTAARLLRAYSDLGKQLDSLADVVSFGLAPAAIMYSMLAETMLIPSSQKLFFEPAALPAFLIALCSALRLAKFNIDPLQTDSFRGLSTPANALFIVSLPLIRLQGAEGQGMVALFGNWLGSFYVLIGLTLLLSMLLVSNIPLMGFKIKSLDLGIHKYKIVFLVLAIILILFLGFGASPFVLALYFVLSAFDHKKKTSVKA